MVLSWRLSTTGPPLSRDARIIEIRHNNSVFLSDSDPSPRYLAMNSHDGMVHGRYSDHFVTAVSIPSPDQDVEASDQTESLDTPTNIDTSGMPIHPYFIS
jgi:hypothetical protein